MIFAGNNTQNENSLVSVFDALGDKTRFSLLKILKDEREICVSELAGRVGISNAGVSQQLKVLEQAGLIERRRLGQKICYTINDDREVNRRLFKLIDKEG